MELENRRTLRLLGSTLLLVGLLCASMCNRVQAAANEALGRQLMDAATRGGGLAKIKGLVGKGDVNARYENDWTILHWAAYGGRLDVVQWLVSQGVDVNVANNDGQTPLHRAATGGYLEVIQYLVEHGAEANAADSRGWTPFWFAAYGGHLVVVRYLVEEHGAEVNAVDDRGNTPLYYATCNRDQSIIRYLEEQAALASQQPMQPVPATPSIRGAQTTTVSLQAVNADLGRQLIDAARKGKLDVVQWLAGHGADINAANNEGSTPLHWAAYGGRLDVVQWLISQGVDIDVANNDGMTALHWATKKGHLRVVKCLVARGANVNLRTTGEIRGLSAGSTALDAARLYGNRSIVTLLTQAARKQAQTSRSSQQQVQPVPKRPSNREAQTTTVSLQAVNADLGRQLIDAARAGKLDVVQWLARHGADINAANNEGSTPLHWAAYGGRLDVVQWLISQGVDIDVANNDGMTALHWATKKGHLRVVKWLVVRGANVNLRTTGEIRGLSAGSTPLDAARLYGKRSIVTLLTQAARKQAQTSRSSQQQVQPVPKRPSIGQAQSTDSNSTNITTLSGENTLLRQQLAVQEEQMRQQRMQNEQMQQQMNQMMQMMQGMQTSGSAGGSSRGKSAAQQLVSCAMQGETEQVVECIQQGASVNTADEEGKTLLILCAENRQEACALELLSYEPACNHQVQTGEHAGRTALHYAVINQLQQLVELLLVVGASPRLADQCGYTPLHWAVSNRNQELVQLLIRYGAQADVRDGKGLTPLVLAKEHRLKAIEALLEQSLPEEADRQCCICLEPLIDGERHIAAAVECGHTVHQNCTAGLDRCPICRAGVGPEDWRRIHLG